MEKELLQKVGEWAQARVKSGEEPPWTYNKLKMLAELSLEFAQALESSKAYTPGMEFVGENIDATHDNIVFFKSDDPELNNPQAPLPA